MRLQKMSIVFPAYNQIAGAKLAKRPTTIVVKATNSRNRDQELRHWDRT